MKLEWLWKDGNSDVKACPALYRTEGGYVVQGRVLNADTRAQLRQLADDEDAVFVPANVLDRLRELS
ncbi:MAG: lipid A biosynthesis lauroyl acyltransferase [Micromonosporaceae bacterium]